MKSFLKNLFDLSFDNFVAVHVVRFTFICWCVASLLFSTVGILEIEDEALLVSPIIFILCVAVGRVTLEMYVAVVRIAENTTKLIEMKESKQALQLMHEDQTE
jgi:hypothetical protein